MENFTKIELSTNAAIVAVGALTMLAIVAITSKGGLYFKSRAGDLFATLPNKQEEDSP